MYTRVILALWGLTVAAFLGLPGAQSFPLRCSSSSLQYGVEKSVFAPGENIYPDFHPRSRRKCIQWQASRTTQLVERGEEDLLPRPTKTSVSTNEERVPTTFPEALRVFFLYNGPRTVSILLLVTVLWRTSLPQSVSFSDAAIIIGMVIFWCLQEHVLHGRVLHSDADWFGKTIHKGHHEKPYHHISVDPAWLMCSWMGAVHVLFRCTLPLPLALSATFGYAMGGMWYEFMHYLAHTRVKFRKGSYFQKMKDHHARHHLIDNRYWLGFSLPAVDTLFGTNPSVAEARRTQK